MINTHQNEISDAVSVITDLENRIKDYEHKRRRRRRRGRLGGLGAVVSFAFPAIGIPVMPAGGAQIQSADDARRAVDGRKRLRNERQQVVNHHKRLRDDAVSEKRSLDSSLSQEQAKLSALQREESNLREFIRQLSEVSSSLMKLTTHLGTVYGTARVTTMESRHDANNPRASTSTLVSNTSTLVRQMGTTKAHLSLASGSFNQLADEAYTQQLLAQVTNLCNGLEYYWF